MKRPMRGLPYPQAQMLGNHCITEGASGFAGKHMRTSVANVTSKGKTSATYHAQAQRLRAFAGEARVSPAESNSTSAKAVSTARAETIKIGVSLAQV